MAGYNLERMTALIVDDNQHMRSLLRAILEGLGVKSIVEGRDGEHAFQRLRDNPEIDLVIADWAMEPVDGLELARRVRTDPESPNAFIPIIMLTGHSERHRVIEARDAGVTEFMVKPVTARALYQRVVSIIESPRPFVRTGSYFGPDRRRKSQPFEGPDRRRNEGEEPAAGDESRRRRAMEQTRAGINRLQKG